MTAIKANFIVTVAEYREAIDSVSQAFASLRSCQPDEKSHEAEAVRHDARELMTMNCPWAKKADRAKAERIIDLTASYLIKNGL